MAVRRIHWLTPVLMVLSLLSGLLLAIGHHIFYSRLEGQQAPSGNYSIGVFTYSKQEANIQIGTALAFISKSALCIAVVIAYAQLFWRAAIRGEDGRGSSLNHLDVTFSVMDNIAYLLRPEIWWRRPFSLLLVVIAWLIPIASIITPATLSVSLAATAPAPTRMVNVPNLDFMSLSFLADMPSSGFHSSANDGKTDLYFYNGPSQSVTRIAEAVAAEGAILPIRPPAPNASWEMDFYAPALKCDPIEGDQRRSIGASLAKYNFNQRTCDTPYGYLSWTTDDVPMPQSNVSFAATSLSADNNTANLYMITAPTMWDTVSLPSHIVAPTCFSTGYNVTANSPMGSFGENSTMLQCRVFNSSYHASFKYTDGEQHVDVEHQVIAETPLSVMEQVYGPSSFIPANCSVLNRNGNTCFFDQDIAKSLSYQAIIDAFNRLVIGSISQIIQPTEGAQKIVSNTSITSTKLLESPELAFLRDRQAAEYGDSFFSLQHALSQTDGEVVKGLSNTPDNTSTLPLQQALEDVFKNLTVSLMSSSELQPNESSPFAPPLTRVTLPQYDNVYLYNATKLWLAYGLAVLFATISVVIGLVAMFWNGASYSNTFSTILRVSRYARVEPEVHEIDADGRDPLPDHLRYANVSFAVRETALKGSEGDIELKEPIVYASLREPFSESPSWLAPGHSRNASTHWP